MQIATWIKRNSDASCYKKPALTNRFAVVENMEDTNKRVSGKNQKLKQKRVMRRVRFVCT